MVKYHFRYIQRYYKNATDIYLFLYFFKWYVTDTVILVTVQRTYLSQFTINKVDHENWPPFHQEKDRPGFPALIIQ